MRTCEELKKILMGHGEKPKPLPRKEIEKVEKIRKLNEVYRKGVTLLPCGGAIVGGNSDFIRYLPDKNKLMAISSSFPIGKIRDFYGTKNNNILKDGDIREVVLYTPHLRCKVFYSFYPKRIIDRDIKEYQSQ